MLKIFSSSKISISIVSHMKFQVKAFFNISKEKFWSDVGTSLPIDENWFGNPRVSDNKFWVARIQAFCHAQHV